MDRQNQLGFPTPLLGLEPLRLDVLHDDGEILILVKPTGVLVQVDPWYPRLPVLIEAICFQAQQKKPEFARIGIGEGGLWAVTDLDPDCYGPVVFARDRGVAEAMRSDVGSGAFKFTYTLLSNGRLDEASLNCDLPITRHRHHPCMLVSHTTGKKAQTQFNLIRDIGGIREYTATTTFARRHQILLHAMESGLPVLGDRLYARDKPVLLSTMKHQYQPKQDRDELPLYDGPAYFLSSVSIGEDLVVSCPLPPRWKGMLRQLERYYRK